MAELLVHRQIDDLDGTDITDSEGAGRIVFALDGVTYEIDLSVENRAKLQFALQPFIDGARRVPARSRTPQSPRRRATATRASAGKSAATAKTSGSKKPERAKSATKKRSTTEPAARKSRAAKPVSLSQQERAAIRQWAKDNGYKLSERGPIKADIIDAYNAAP